MNEKLTNNQELYCQARLRGLSQRAAYREAYPRSSSWSDDSVDSAASRLEANSKVSTRLEKLREQSARAAALDRATILARLDTLADMSAKAVGDAYRSGQGIDPSASRALVSASRELLPYAAEPEPEGRSFSADFALLLADPYIPYHRALARDAGGEYVATGGRLSAKSSWASLEIVSGMMRHPDRSALVVVKVGNDIRNTVYEKIGWAISTLGLSDEWRGTVQPIGWTLRSTGQKIVFKGCDDPGKSKGYEAPGDTYFAYQWFEEFDQFAGMREIRTVMQSATRGAPEGAPFFRFLTCNPPRTASSWANKDMAAREAAGMRVLRTTVYDLPREWVPDQVWEDIASLRSVDEESWRHEWMGEPVGYGANVFPRARVEEVPDSVRAQLERHWYGVDWGFAADPWCWVKVGYDRRTRTLYVLDEMHGLGLSNAETARMAAERMGAARLDAAGREVEPAEPYAEVQCDSAEPKSIDEWRGAGIRAYPAPKQGAHSVRSSVRWLQDRAAIVIDPRCELAASEFPAYEYERTRDGEVTGRLPDRDNHAIDAVRYACARLIEDRTA